MSGGADHGRVDVMDARQRAMGAMATDAATAGWRELHLALMAGLPYATEIVMLLDARGVTFPTAPSFDARHTDLRCYRVVHRAWRAGILPDLLGLLQAWRLSGDSLGEEARRPEFQQALFEFLCEHRTGLRGLVERLSREPLWRTMPTRETASVEAVRRHLDIIWTDFCRRAA
ncbi:MAG TPA: hypothetical protein VHC22_01505 [Pirellulales bacterium]|nr:hypothetical protein [Pirellulales bacterium]